MAVKTIPIKISDFKTSWIQKQIDAECIQFMEDVGFYLCDKRRPEDQKTGWNAVTISQIRNLFGEVKRIKVKVDSLSDKTDNTKDWSTDFLLLKPKIAYNSARVLAKQKTSRIKLLKQILEKAHESVDDDPDAFKRFAMLLEGIIAYHKVYGGRD